MRLNSSHSRIAFILFLLICLMATCGQDNKQQATTKVTTPGPPKVLDYGTLSSLIGDMKTFATAIQSRDQKALQTINDRYSNTLFLLETKPLLYQVYASGKQVVFLIYPKDPRTGSDYLLHLDKKIPATATETIELQIRTKDPNTPLHCEMDVSDPQSYVKEYQNHDMLVRFTLRKQFLQSGTYDFDGLLYPSYRVHGYPFVVFDLLKTDLMDRTTKTATSCRQ